MSKYIFSVAIECGEKTCYDGKKFCNYYGVRRFGAISVCMFFNEDLTEDENLRVLRCDKCISQMQKCDDETQDGTTKLIRYFWNDKEVTKSEFLKLKLESIQ